MLKGIIAVVGMSLVGMIVWRILQWQGNATDAHGNIIDRKGRK